MDDMDELAHIFEMVGLIDYQITLFKIIITFRSRESSLSKFHDIPIPCTTTPDWFKRFCLQYPLQLFITLLSTIIIHAILQLVYRYADAQYYRVFSPPCYGCTRYPRCCRPRSATVNYVLESMFLLALTTSPVA